MGITRRNLSVKNWSLIDINLWPEWVPDYGPMQVSTTNSMAILMAYLFILKNILHKFQKQDDYRVKCAIVFYYISPVPFL